MATCTGPSCSRPAVAYRFYAGASLGLCASHYRQVLRGQPLTALRLGAARLAVTVRVSKAAAKAVAKDREGAREALERWAARQ